LDIYTHFGLTALAYSSLAAVVSVCCSDATDDSSVEQLLAKWKADGCDDRIIVDIGYGDAILPLCYI